MDLLFGIKPMLKIPFSWLERLAFCLKAHFRLLYGFCRSADKTTILT